MQPLERWALFVLSLLSGNPLLAGTADRAALETEAKKEMPSLIELYRHLHSDPELSFHEARTSERLADEFRKAGFEVATGIGKFGVVAVLRNGQGPTVLVRTDMDALPVKEQTGLPYASTAMTKDSQGIEVSVMHACGHDVHMACAVGAARALARLNSQWHGTLVVIGQPAEEKGGGARAMLVDGLFQKFPKPNFCLALHDSAELPSGMIGYTSGFSAANVNSVDLTVYGVGGHGAHPDKTKDPIVLAARIVLALQTIVSREIPPGEPAVVTVGSIHGGTKHNIIPDEVQLQLTVRSYSEEVRKKLLEGIERIAKGEGVAAGLPEDKLPRVSLSDDVTAALYNDPLLTDRMVALFKKLFGEGNVVPRKPTMGGEDFSEFGRTADRIPVFMFSLGAVRPESVVESQHSGKPLPSLHSSLWAPNAEPAIQTGVVAMTAAVFELMNQGQQPAQ
jgi:hippurate hydrolase